MNESVSETTRRRWLATASKLLVGGGLLLFLVSRVGWGEILDALAQIRLSLLPLAAGALAATHLFHAIALWPMISGSGVTFREIFFLGLRSWVWGMVTPARVGELSLVYYLQGRGVRIGEGTAVVLLDRLIVLLLVGLMALGGAIHLGIDVPFLALVSLLLLVALGVLVLASWRRLIEGIGGWLPQRFQQPWWLLSTTLNQLLFRRPWTLCTFVLLQGFRLVTQFWILHLFFVSAGVDIPFFDVCVVSSVARLAAIVPVSINGLGIREGVMVMLFHRISGVPEPTILAVAIWLNVLLYVGAGITYLLLPSFTKR